jgi:DNA-binding transcriptional MerR regulator
MSEEAGEAAARGRKSPGAYRTISEVADDLQVPQHVLRFWETKFPQIRPLKRGGGRRYYRPEDILLLRRISDLLYVQGYTIKGVQRLLKEGPGGDGAPDSADDGDEEPMAEMPAAAPAPAPRPQLALPGMADAPEPSAPAKPVVRVRAESSASPRLAEAATPDELAAAEAEIARLRALLVEAASELHAVRVLLAKAVGAAP